MQACIHPLREGATAAVVHAATEARKTSYAHHHETDGHEDPVLVLDSDIKAEGPFIENNAPPLTNSRDRIIGRCSNGVHAESSHGCKATTAPLP
mmetsp:Transcript_73064/g.144885  ORF Transcript_73064/g.144885 Transcript_73064/m.144885 type:complete len:94 (+) Transcript_73064:771-1052(+)